jgi:trimethylamine corrinoid protein
MEQERILENLAAAVVDGDQDMVRESAEQALASQMDPLEAVDHGLSQGMAVIGEQFELGEVFLPELLMAADAFDAAMEILNPEIKAQKKQITRLGIVVLGTVKGDVHNIGKNIVATVLQINGFDVVDIGMDNSTLDIIEEACEAKADIVALSLERDESAR